MYRVSISVGCSVCPTTEQIPHLCRASYTNVPCSGNDDPWFTMRFGYRLLFGRLLEVIGVKEAIRNESCFHLSIRRLFVIELPLSVIELDGYISSYGILSTHIVRYAIITGEKYKY